MWLQARLNDLNYDVKDFARDFDMKISTVHGWIHRGVIPHKISEIGELERLATLLQWDMVDLLRAIGYTHFITVESFPDAFKTFLMRYDDLPAWKQDLVLIMIHGAFNALDDMPDDPLDALSRFSE